MKIIKRYYHNDSCITVTETDDSSYARQCFDGTLREWLEVMAESEDGKLYIVSSGLAGLYMADSVSVYGMRTDALVAAKDEYNRWIEEDEDMEAISES